MRAIFQLIYLCESCVSSARANHNAVAELLLYQVHMHIIYTFACEIMQTRKHANNANARGEVDI